MSTSYHPQTDGQSERANRTVEDMLRCTCQDCPSDWDDQLPLIQFAYNNSVSQSTGYSPFYLMSGFNPNTIATLVVPADTGEIPVHAAGPSTTSENPAVETMLSNLQRILGAAATNLDKAVEHQRLHADKHRRHVTYQPGDEVLLSTANLPMATSRVQRKLHPRFVGPFAVLEVLSDVAVRLAIPAAWKVHPVFHVSLLRLFQTSSRFSHGDRRPPPVQVEGQEEFFVENFVAKRTRYGRLQYLVQWRGYPLHDAEWLFVDDLKHDLSSDVFRQLSSRLELLG